MNTTTSALTPLERERAMREGHAPDRLPYLVFADGLKCQLTGATPYEYWHDARTMAEVEIAAYERWGHDRITIGPNSLGFTEAFGGKFIYPEHGMPFDDPERKFALDELLHLEPLDPTKNPQLKVYIEALDILMDALGDTAPIQASLGGPLTTCAFLCGTEQLLRNFTRRAEDVAALLQVVTESLKAYIDVAATHGARFYMADPVANPALIGIKRYEKYLYPLMRELTACAKTASGAGVMLHMCGKSEKQWPLFRDYALEAISLDNAIDLEEAIRQLGDCFAIAGNVDPVNIISRGTTDVIKQDVARCQRVGQVAEHGFFVAPGCDIPYGTALSQVDAYATACAQAPSADGTCASYATDEGKDSW
ncbi:MAG: uroporphyrinogen decarboxylase family protein [Atopobiaceae bacterium]